ncbi:hypothetical protein M8J75_015817 [Diaphorina citri]|nr:hypothetical protein M8J75_015817 [Diaphorina citri]
MFKIFQRFCSTSKHWSLERLTETNMLSITNLQAEQKYHYPFVWLRDNCQCPQCFNATSKSRIMDLKTNLKVKPIDIDIQRAFDRVSNDLEKSTDVTGESGTGNVGSNDVKSGDFNLNIRWEDNHRSEFPLDWLIARNFTAANRVRLDEIYRIPRIPWTSEQFPEICSKFAFEDLMTDGRALLAWMECLATYGVAIVDRAGVEMGALNRLASRVGFLKRTQYGETFRVENKPGTSNVAYLSSKLQLHTDLPYYEYKPGINMLHCIIQASDPSQGINQLTDCLSVCRHLAANRQSVYETLSRTLVDWTDYGEDNRYRFANIHRAPVIALDARGEVTRINFSQPQRDSVFNAPLEEVLPWYEAFAEFADLLHDPKYLVELRLRPGEVLTFDNIRLVHGREGYTGERLLEGAYLDWDLVRSRIRILRSELGEE